MAKRKVLVTGAAGYVAGLMLPTLREKYDLTLLDVSDFTSAGRNHPHARVPGVQIADLTDPNRSKYAKHFDGIDTVVHLGYVRQTQGEQEIDQYWSQRANIDMCYNVLRASHDAGVSRIVSASSNHAANWWERDLISKCKLENLDPYTWPLSYNFYGWSKSTYEHLGFLFANGGVGRRMGVVMVRIGGPGELDLSKYEDLGAAKRGLGAWLSPRDLTQLFVKAIDTPSIDNEHGIPWQVVYGISNNTRAFWSLANARKVLGYEPQDDSEVRYAKDIERLMTGKNTVGRLDKQAP
ncbi:MAG: NAD(P)-dependent oxidoreductase [SAR202 cluster bacterium]|nr:NAD(P)-dependent oxidoreductase [SAR202 cluster bacterium]